MDEDVKFDYQKLRGRIKEKLKQENEFARKIGISAASLSYKLNGGSDFTSKEIYNACREDVLDIPKEEIPEYFFTEKLELNSRRVI